MNKTCSTMFFAVLFLNSILLGAEPSFMGFKEGEYVAIWVKTVKDIDRDNKDYHRVEGLIESVAEEPYSYIRIKIDDGTSLSFKGYQVLEIKSCKPFATPSYILFDKNKTNLEIKNNPAPNKN